jgi:hypothetical protein
MNELDWKLAKGFSPKEPWGDSHKMDTSLLWLMSTVRRMYRERFDANASFVIHNGHETKGHKVTGYHPRGLATDFHIVTKLMFWEQVDALETIFAELEVVQYIGLGIYPDWNNPGFHLDTRLEIGRWGRIGEDYVKLTLAYDYAKSRGI